MLFLGKSRGKAEQKKESLYPVLYVTDSLKEYKKELIDKVVESLRELGMVNSSFSGVLEKRIVFRKICRILENLFQISMRWPGSLLR